MLYSPLVLFLLLRKLFTLPSQFNFLKLALCWAGSNTSFLRFFQRPCAFLLLSVRPVKKFLVLFNKVLLFLELFSGLLSDFVKAFEIQDGVFEKGKI